MTWIALIVPLVLVGIATASDAVPLVVPGLVALPYASVWLFWRPRGSR